MNVLSNAVKASHSKLDLKGLRIVYENDGEVDFYRNHQTDTELYTLDTDDTFYIVFRGTEVHCFKDILTDANAFTTPYGNGKTKIRVNRGVYNAYLSTRSVIHKKIYNLINKEKKRICVIGHSLGGGLAPLCAVDIQYHYYTDPNWVDLSCYIYGALKVFNKEGVISYNKRVPYTINVQNTRDIVPHMPPFMGYKHVGEIWKIKSDHILQNHDIVYGYINHITEPLVEEEII